MSLKNKRVTVMGLGLHGGALGTIEWLTEQGAKVTVTDLKTEGELETTLSKLHPLKIQYVLGQHREEDFVNADLVIRNPAVPKNSPYLQAARKAGVPVEMDSSLFFLNSPTNDIIGVTGSKGKTTAANAIAHMLGAIAVGTDGISPLGKLKDVSKDSTVVFELSSWRLEALAPHHISPRVAIVTSIYREHLNTYQDFQEYIDAKKIIIRHQKPTDTAILNWDDQELRTWEKDVKGKLLWFSMKELPVGKEGIFVKGGNVFIQMNSQHPLLISPLEKGKGAEHEQRNILPAILIGALRGMTAEQIKAAMQSLPRLRHRLEQIAIKNGVTYINDSAATMPDATIAALRAYQDKTLVLILGGSDKKLEFEELAREVATANIRGIIWLPGTATERMQLEKGEKVCESMQAAVKKATQLAKSGDIVLLSPGATSFGLFQHEFDRGDQFRKAVLNL